VGNHTKFDPVTKPPQALDRVIGEIERRTTVKNSGFFLPTDFEAIVESADRNFYRTYAHSAGLRKFLVDHHIVLKEGNKFFVDFDRASVLLRACQDRVRPPVPTPIQQRITQLKAAKAIVAPSIPSSAGVEKKESMIVKREPPPDVQVKEVVTELPVVPQPEMVSVLPLAHTKMTTCSLKHVLFLTPIEMDVWTTLCALARNALDIETRVAIEKDQDKFYFECASNKLKDCTPEMYAETINRFIKARLVCEVGNVIEGKRAFKFLVEWKEFFCIEIKSRTISYVEKVYLSIIDEIEKDAIGVLRDRSRTRARLDNWIKRNHPQLNADTVRLKVSQYYTDNPSTGWGIFFRHEPTGRRLLCWTSFEQYEFLEKKDAVQSKNEVVVQAKAPVLSVVRDASVAVSEAFFQKWMVKCHPSHAVILLEIADGTFRGSLMKAMTATFVVGLRSRGFLHQEGQTKSSKWTINYGQATEFRFRLKTSTTELSKFEHVTSKSVSSDRWRKDLEEIAAHVSKPYVPYVPPIVQSVVAPVEPDVVAIPVEPDMVDRPTEEKPEDVVEEVSIMPVAETQEGVEMETRSEMSIEDLKAKELRQQEAVNSAVEALEQAQKVFDECVAELQQTRLEIKAYKRNQREAIEQQMRQLQAQLAELGD
jgi:hypothetical protein